MDALDKAPGMTPRGPEMAGRTVVLASKSGQFGGMEIRMIEEARFLLSLGSRVVAATPRFQDEADFSAAMDELGVACERFEPAPLLTDWRLRHLHWLRARLSGGRRLARLRADLMHVFMSWTDQGLEQLWAARQIGLPTVISVHNAFPPCNFTPWHRRHIGHAFEGLRGVYAVSRSALGQFEAIFGAWIPEAAARRVIYNAVDSERFRPLAERTGLRAGLGLDPDAPLIGSLGRFDDQKRPLSLIAVFARVRAQLPAARLLLVGRGPLEAEMRAEIDRLGLAAAVTILDHCPDPERLYPALDVHLLVSRNEGFGLVTAEAMACGVPVVGTRVPGTEEIIEGSGGGTLVPLGDIEAAAEAVLELLRAGPERRAEIGAAGRRSAIARFGRESWRQQLEAFYRLALVASPPAARARP